MSIWQDVLLLLSNGEKLSVGDLCEKLPQYTNRQIRTNINSMRQRGHLESATYDDVEKFVITTKGKNKKKVSVTSQKPSRQAKIEQNEEAERAAAFARIPLEAAWPMRLQA